MKDQIVSDPKCRDTTIPAEFPKSDRFDHVHIDVIVLAIYKSYKYCLTIIDRLSRWPERVSLKDMFAETVAENFYAT